MSTVSFSPGGDSQGYFLGVLREDGPCRVVRYPSMWATNGTCLLVVPVVQLGRHLLQIVHDKWHNLALDNSLITPAQFYCRTKNAPETSPCKVGCVNAFSLRLKIALSIQRCKYMTALWLGLAGNEPSLSLYIYNAWLLPSQTLTLHDKFAVVKSLCTTAILQAITQGSWVAWCSLPLSGLCGHNVNTTRP